MAEEAKKKRFDSYTNSIQLTQLPEGKKIDHQKHLHESMGEVYKMRDIDQMIEILNEAENHIKDAEWVKDQKKKFKFQQDIALRMQ